MKISAIILTPLFLGCALAQSGCPAEQKHCHVFEGGRLGYAVNKVNQTDRTCSQVCTTGVSSYLGQGYKCGNCTWDFCNQPEPCADFGNGFLGSSIHQISSQTGECRERCTAGNTLAQYLYSGGYTCGKCPKPSCPEAPCRDHGNGWFAYWIHQVDEEKKTCTVKCTVGNSLASDLHSQKWKCGQECPDGYGAPLREGPSCPGQDTPCKIFGNGWAGYNVYMVNATDGTCTQYCAASTSLTSLIDRGAKCGKCEKPSCPNQETCKDFGNGWLGYSIYKMDADGKCSGLCAAGNALAQYLHTGGYMCGKCGSPP